MPKNNMIVWEKWIDPFAKDNMANSDEPDTYNDNLDDDEQLLPPHHMVHTKAIITPLGVIPLHDLSMNEVFNFWIGHTNFNLSKEIASIIEQSEGVEILDIISRYRFRIGIGKIFTDRDVMKIINDNVYDFIEKYYDREY